MFAELVPKVGLPQ